MMILKVLLGTALCLTGAWGETPSSHIDHIVVLMMENHSFDNLLGYLKQHNLEIDGLFGNESLLVDTTDPSKGRVTVNSNGPDKGPDDPLHGFSDTTEQIYGFFKPVGESATPLMNGFVQSAKRVGHELNNPMSMFSIDSESAPIINTLALEFAVFDRWYASVPGPTDPNRGFSMSGTSNGMTTNFNGTLWNQQSYFEFLRQHNKTFRAYYQDDPWAVVYFEDMHTATNSKNIFQLDGQFYTDAAAGDLAQFSWLQPRMTTHEDRPPSWQHPDASVREGERLIKSVYEAVRASPAWERTLLLITYDEHGGFYDHVPPPQDNIPPPDAVRDSTGFGFDRLGIRVPTIAISPYIAKGVVEHDPPASQGDTFYEGTSVIATSSALLGVTDNMGQRDAWSGTFEHLISLSSPRSDCPTTLPELPAYTAEQAAEQMAAPLSDSLQTQVMFYCVHVPSHLVPTADHASFCDGSREFEGQGEASSWLVDMVEAFWESLHQRHALEEVEGKLASS